MAKAQTTPEPVTGDDEEWEDIRLGLGDEWDFEALGPLTGNFLGSTTQMVDDREQTVYQFAPMDEPERVVFVWGSNQLDLAFAADPNGNPLIHVGDKVRIIFLGRQQFTSDEGPRQVKRYRVQVAKTP